MYQSAQDHTLIIKLQLDNLGNALRCEVDQVRVIKGKSSENKDSAAQNHFDCLHCKARYFIVPEIEVRLKVVSNANTQAQTKNEPEFVLFDTGSLDDLLTEDGTQDDDDMFQGVEQKIPHVVMVKNEEAQEDEEFETVTNDCHIQVQRLAQKDAQMKDIGQNNHQRQNKVDYKTKKKLVYQCDICKASIKNRYNLTSHMKLHSGIRFFCSECPKSFSRKSRLTVHKKSFHQSELRICALCKWTKTCAKSEYLSHLRHRHPKFHIKEFRPKVQDFNGVDFPCCYCELQTTFKTFNELKEHLAEIHDRTFACTQCPKAFGDWRNLSHHIESVHEKKTFNCTECDKVFMLKVTLEKHLLSHNM